MPVNLASEHIIEPSRASFTHQRVNAHWTCTCRKQIQENKAVQDRELAAIGNRPEAAGCMRVEVCKSHFAAQDNRDRPCEKAQNQQRPTNGFQNCGEPEKCERRDFAAVAAHSAECPKFLQTVKGESEPRDDT